MKNKKNSLDLGIILSLSLGIYLGRCVAILIPFIIFSFLENLVYFMGYDKTYTSYVIAPINILVLSLLHCYTTLILLKKKPLDYISENKVFIIVLKVSVVFGITILILHRDTYLSNLSLLNCAIHILTMIFIPLILSCLVIDNTWYSFIWTPFKTLFCSLEVFIKWLPLSIIIYLIVLISNCSRVYIGLDLITPILYPMSAIITTVFIMRARK